MAGCGDFCLCVLHHISEVYPGAWENFVPPQMKGGNPSWVKWRDVVAVDGRGDCGPVLCHVTTPNRVLPGSGRGGKEGHPFVWGDAAKPWNIQRPLSAAGCGNTNMKRDTQEHAFTHKIPLSVSLHLSFTYIFTQNKPVSLLTILLFNLYLFLSQDISLSHFLSPSIPLSFCLSLSCQPLSFHLYFPPPRPHCPCVWCCGCAGLCYIVLNG